MSSDVAALLAEVISLFPDNSTGEISPADVRTSLSSIISSCVNNTELSNQAMASNLTYVDDLPNNWVIVNNDAQLPTTLAANTVYWLGASFSTSTDRTVLSGSKILGGTPFGPKITYTGTGTLFTGAGVDFVAQDVVIDATTGKIFDFSSSGVIVLVNVGSDECQDFGTFDNIQTLQTRNVSAVNCTATGIVLSGSGNWVILDIGQTNMIGGASASSFVGLDLGNMIVDTMKIIDSVFAPLHASAFGISGLVSSGNITASNKAQLQGCTFLGAGTPLENISSLDLRWRMLGNSASVPNSKTEADSYLTASRTVTNPGLGVFVDINGTNWTSTITERISVSTAGVMTSDTEGEVDFLATGTATISKSGGGADQLALRIRKNSTDLAQSQAVTENATPVSVPCQALMTLDDGDTAAFQIANLDSGANDMIVADANLILKA